MIPSWSFGQWQPANVPFRMFGVHSINADTADDALYFSGNASLNNDFDTSDGAIPIYRNGQWDTLSVIGGDPYSIVRYGDTLVVAGNFWPSPDVPFLGIAGLVNGTWIPYGTLDENSVYRLKVINGDLYAIGAFTQMDGQPCQGVAKRQSGQWVPVGSFTNVASSPYIQDLVQWNGTLYATGVISFSGPAPNHVAYLAPNGEWLPLGPGIRGGFGAGRALAVYNDELYVSGSIPIAAGNAGHGIMRWDGQQFHPVGTGFQGLDGLYTYLVGAIELEVYDNKLWACGTFSYAGNVPCPGIAYWDGQRWCGLPLGIQPEVNTIEFFHDTLFASCNNWDINCAMRFTGSAYSDSCSASVGVAERAARAPLRAYRTANGAVEVSGVPPGPQRYAVLDPAGRAVQTGQASAHPDGWLRFSLPPQPHLVLLVRVEGIGTARLLGP